MSDFYEPAEKLGIKSCFEEYDYQLFYDVFNFTGSVVLDAGADYGSTAQFFLEKGCKEVICVESNETHFKNLTENARRNPKIKPIKLEVSNEEHWRYLISLKPDIIKSDCEFCEKHLL